MTKAHIRGFIPWKGRMVARFGILCSWLGTALAVPFVYLGVFYSATSEPAWMAIGLGLVIAATGWAIRYVLAGR